MTSTKTRRPRRLAPPPGGWQDRALCAQSDPEMFFPEAGGAADARQAKQVCGSCGVRAECLGYALEHDERFGIWGGLSQEERRGLKRAGASSAPSAVGLAISQAASAALGERPVGPSPGPRPPHLPALPPPPAVPAPPPESELIERCRHGQDPIARAEAIGALLRRGLTTTQIAQQASLTTTTISRHRMLLDLDQATQHLVRTGRLSITAAAAAVRAAGPLMKAS